MVRGAVVAEAGGSPALSTGGGLVFLVSNIPYAQLTTYFTPRRSGRVNTALNLSAVVGTFSIQRGFGVLLDFFANHGIPARDAFRIASGITLLIQTVTFVGFVFGEWRNTKQTG